ncbi:MAG: hypothetical protein A4E43_01082 [Methanosaeta sp. PtaB.Bin005]|nr:MAG: hypothetical protein A4E43_01082 [Methanosaeta sp. PtaB.Bin005]
MAAEGSQDHIISLRRDELVHCPFIYEVVSIYHQELLVHILLGLEQGMSSSQELILLDVGDGNIKVYAILKVVHHPLFLVSDHHINVLDSVCSQSANDVLHKRPVAHGKHDLGSGLGKRSASAAFSCRQYHSLQIYHSQNAKWIRSYLALDLFGQLYLKNMNRS